ncbi:MAG: hypothetical protein RMJ87_08840 [Cytophagales bacterium]|nr:hypothetical protein [Bernardetiaceae bacterium]MDW8205119.1 hypothetical protein [Cytophagales bacterium]
MHPLFKNRIAALATMHAKEQIIAPILAEQLGMQVQVAAVNTDLFGTFTGEIERQGTQRHAARLKCEAAIRQTGYPIGLASEGSFGPHPTVPFVAANCEMVMLVDTQLGIEVCGEYFTTETNFSQKSVTSVEQALEFADNVGFPAHGLIVRTQPIVKGIRDYETLTHAVSKGLAASGAVWIETDMRAMHNPTRCKAIAAAVADLVARLSALCPQCSKPGFGKGKAIVGLPCSWCGLPTQQPKGYTLECPTCGYAEEVLSKEHQEADPAFCSFCNP